LDIWKKTNKCYIWISEIVIFDIQNKYFGYQKLCKKSVLFEISKKVILDIRNYAKKAFYLRYPKKLFWISKNNNFGYPKINIYFGYPK